MKEVASKLSDWREHPSQMVREMFGVNPDPWQEEALEAFPRNPRLAMKAPIALDEVVWTPSGQRMWGSIVPGDSVFADDGTVTRVVRRFDTGVVPLFRVQFRDGTSVRVSNDHLWKVRTAYDRKKATWRTVSTERLLQMRRRDRSGQRLISIPTQGPVQFAERDLPSDPYLLGLWLGDGIANEPRLICPDYAIRHELLARGHLISESTRVPKRIGIKGWLPSLRASGVAKSRSFEKFIPENYKTSSKGQRLDLLRGLMDSDGTCATNGHCYLASSSERLIDDFMWLARSLGYLATKMGPYKINGGENRDSFRAVLCGPVCPFMADTSKRRRWRKPRVGKYARFIDSIRAVEAQEAMCIEVEHASSCFQIGDFIVTHNCKGPGKTAALAWMGWNFLLTRPHPKGAAVSNSGPNLRDNLWTEMAKWRNAAPFLQQQFEWTAKRIFARDHPETWFLSARTWRESANPQQQADTLAGIHADYVFFLVDESGSIPEAVMVSADAALSSCIEGHIVQAGNPTKLSGPLYRACTIDRKYWYVVEITGDPDSPKRSSRISIEWARSMIARHGRENPWVLVNVFGQFPPSSLNVLIGPDEVSEAMKRYYRDYEIGQVPRVLGVDVARFGDDGSVIADRKGIQMFPLRRKRNLNSTQGASWVAHTLNETRADACFIDMTGGFGTGWYDQLENINYSPIGVQFSGEAHDKRKFANKRVEMAFDFVEWIKMGGALPPENSDGAPELMAALTETQYTFFKDKLILEDKSDIKLRLGYSPDEFDAAILTFAEPVMSPAVQRRVNRSAVAPSYDPFGELERQVRQSYGQDYDPFR